MAEQTVSMPRDWQMPARASPARDQTLQYALFLPKLDICFLRNS